MVKRVDPSLHRDLLVSAAFEQLEDDGMEKLSMTRIAARLGVQTPALYWHVRNKAELLGLMSKELLQTAHDAAPKASGWRKWLIGFGDALHSTLGSRRDAALLVAVARPFPNVDSTHYVEERIAPLVRLGIRREQAVLFQGAVIALAVGWSIAEVNRPMHEFLEPVLDFEEGFGASLSALVEGLAAQVDAAAAKLPDKGVRGGV